MQEWYILEVGKCVLFREVSSVQGCQIVGFNIIASEQSGVECACACVLRIVENFVVAYLELRTTLRYVQRPRDIYRNVPVETTRSARSLANIGIHNSLKASHCMIDQRLESLSSKLHMIGREGEEETRRSEVMG